MHHSDNHTTIVSGGVLYGYSRKFVFQSKCLVIIFFIFFLSDEYVNLFERTLDFWKNKDYKQEYWSALYKYKQEKGEKDIIVERNYIEWQHLCPCDQRRFDLCARMDVDGLHLESEKQKNSMISENPTAFTFLTQIIFESNGKSKITTIKFDGYEGMF